MLVPVNEHAREHASDCFFLGANYHIKETATFHVHGMYLADKYKL